MTELRRVDREDDLGGRSGERQLGLGVEQRRLARPELGVERRGAHEQATQHHVAAARVASGPTRLPVDSSSSPPVSNAVTPGWPCSERNVSSPLVSTVRLRTGARRVGQSLQRRRGVDADRSADTDEIDQLVGDPSLGPGVLLRPGGELLGPDGDGAAPNAVSNTLVDEHVEVPANRHLADVELAGELHDPDATVDIEAPADQPEPVHRFEVHGVIARTSDCGSHSVRLASATEPNTPRASPWDIALPSAVASTGPTVTAPSTCSARRLQQQLRSRPAAEHLDARQAELGDDGGGRLRHRLDSAADDLRP